MSLGLLSCFLGGSFALDWTTARFSYVEEFKNELLQLARTKLGGPYVGSMQADPDAYKAYIQKMLNSLVSSSSK